MSKSIVLYDGACYLCRQSKRIFQRLDWFHKLQWISIQDYEKDHPLDETKKSAIQKELHVLLSHTQEKRGYYAVIYLMKKCPLTFIPGLIFSIPGSSVIGKPLYKWIARNRYKIFKNKCKGGACSIPKT